MRSRWLFVLKGLLFAAVSQVGWAACAMDLREFPLSSFPTFWVGRVADEASGRPAALVPSGSDLGAEAAWNPGGRLVYAIEVTGETGPNTAPGPNETVTCGAVTLTYARVAREGNTRAAALAGPCEPLPEGCRLVGAYEVATTAGYAGPVALAVQTPAGMDSGGYELLHYENGAWVRITVPPSGPEVVEGQCDELGHFALVRWERPIADFLAAPVKGAFPLTVHFAEASLGQPTAWCWQFGDGSVSYDRNPSHLYAAPGRYTVGLTVSNAGGSNTCKQTNLVLATAPPSVMTVSARPTVITAGGSERRVYCDSLTARPLPPTAVFSAQRPVGPIPLTGCAAEEPVAGPTFRRWAFGDGGGSTEPVGCAHVSPGVLTMALTVGIAGGRTTEIGVSQETATAPPPLPDFAQIWPYATCRSRACSEETIAKEEGL